MLTPRTGVYITGLVYMFSSIGACYYTVRKFGRRTLLIWGHILIVILHAFIGIFNNRGNNAGVLAMVLIFIFVYQNTSGPVTWVYAAETTTDAGLGIGLFTLWITVFILTLISPMLMGRNSLGASNVFFIYSILSLLGAIYSYFIIKETQGLTDKEKKNLFTPSRYLNSEGNRRD